MSQLILVIDDSPVALEVARDSLEENGFEVRTASNVQEARECVFGNPQPNLILLDIMMPDIEGDKLCARLKEDERTKHIPVIIISTKEKDELEKRAADAGADGYLQKAALTDSGLLDTIQTFLGE